MSTHRALDGRTFFHGPQRPSREGTIDIGDCESTASKSIGGSKTLHTPSSRIEKSREMIYLILRHSSGFSGVSNVVNIKHSQLFPFDPCRNQESLGVPGTQLYDLSPFGMTLVVARISLAAELAKIYNVQATVEASVLSALVLGNPHVIAWAFFARQALG